MVETPASSRRKRGLSTTGDESATKKQKVEESPSTYGNFSSRRSAAARAAWERRKAAEVERIFKRRPKPQDDGNDGDDGEPTTPSKSAAKRKREALKDKEADPYDLPVPDAHQGVKRSGKKNGASTAATPNGIRSIGKKSIPVTEIQSEDESGANIYDVTQIDDSPSKPATGKRRGRPPGSKNKGPTATLPSRTARDLELTPTKKRLGGRGVDGDVPGSPAVLKGILTPSKRRNDDTPRARKNVAFTGKDDFDIFFDDLPSKKKSEPRKVQESPRPAHKDTESKQPPASDPAEKDEDEDEEDEDVCEICLKPDSNPPNEIIFCDGCDLGFHQKCHNVPEIPDDDWFCKNCSQDDAAKTPQRASVIPRAPPTDAPDIPNLDRHLSALQRVLLDRCTGRKRLNLLGLDEAYGKVKQLVEKTITEGEGNSMLLIGGRGTGKTALIEKVVDTMSESYNGEFLVVRLNGFIHTDDKLALKDIWRQLGKEMDVDDDLMTRNYADTMASLLALLSHPSEITGVEEDVTSQAVIFVIDEFDMFTYHPRQTLLYNLFDIAQARKAPIAVLGCTGKVDVVEMLEKRVKSRFSHRYVFVPPARSLTAYWDVCRQGLAVDKEAAEKEGLETGLEGFDEFMEYWSKKVDRLYKQESFQLFLKSHFYTTKSPTIFLTSFVLPLSTLSPANLTLQIPRPPTIPSLSAPHSKLHLLSSLSDLDLALLIAAARIEASAHTDTVNFSMAYDEYASLMGRQRVQSSAAGMLALGGGVRVWSRGVALVSWERLAEMGLLLPGRIGGKGVGVEGRMWGVDVGIEEIEGATRLSTVLAKWCRDLP